MKKEFIPYDRIRNDALKLAWRIVKSGFFPDVIYVSLRGGAYLGNILSEYFKVLRSGDRPVFYAAVVAHSYTDVRNQSNVRVDGWTYNPKYLRSGDKVLLVDDIFDTGRTINHLINVILKHGLPREDVKIAVHDYKVYLDRQTLPIEPDFYCEKHVVEKPEEDVWIHYLSHELVGLTMQDFSELFPKNDQELQEALSALQKPELKLC